jgi:uncharacterized protein
VRVVLDTNVLLAAFATRGLCEAVFAVCLESHPIVLSQAILNETHRHLAGKFKMPDGQARQIVEFLEDHCELVEPAKVPVNACRDADDLMVLGTLLAGKANCLVTGDKDLLDLGEFRGISILTPRQFYDRLK